jgi:hypothetical protein
MSCPNAIIAACDFPQFLVDQTPKFDELIMEDIRPTDGWLLNVSTGTTPMGTPTEITQDRFRAVFPNTTKVWTKTVANGAGCQGNPCDPVEHQIGWGADRLTYYAEQQSWQTPLLCYDADMHITHAMEHIQYIINDILRPATTAISSNFLRKRALLWAKTKWVANGNAGMPSTDGEFTYKWSLAGPNGDEEIYFDCSVSPSRVFLLAPQMLQHRFNRLMLRGYAGKNPFSETSPFIELVTDMDTCWSLDKMGGAGSLGGAVNGGGGLQQWTVAGNWRFTEWDAANKYWRYGYSGQVGNFMVRVDPMGIRFNYVGDLGSGAAPNRYRYQVVLPYRNNVTTGAGSSPGLGSDPNPDYDRAHYQISYIWHKKAMELLVPDAAPLNPEMPFGHRDFGGKWQFVMDNLGADQNNNVISNKRRNKGQFISDFKYYVRPLHYEFSEAIFHQREWACIPEIATCEADPGYPSQAYNSALPNCNPTLPSSPTAWPADNTGPIPVPQTTAVIEGTTAIIATGNTEPTLKTQNSVGIPNSSGNPPDQ